MTGPQGDHTDEGAPDADYERSAATGMRGTLDQVDLFSYTPQVKVAGRPTPLDAGGADATMRRRWQSLTLTAPIQQLVRNIAHIDLDDDAYDVRQLALSAIDVVVASMGYGQEATVETVQDHLVGLARHMNSEPATDDEPTQVASAVLAGLLNHSGEQRRFTYRYADLSTDPNSWERYAFKLLALRETEHGDCLIASDQAVMLYVAALDADLEDAEAAHAVMLRRQLADGRLDAAEFSAAQARRTSEGYSANLTQLLTDTVRDVTAHDWTREVPRRLGRAHKHIRERLGDDNALLEHLRAGLDTDVTTEVRDSSGRIIDLLVTGRDMHLAVLDALVGARSVHLESLTRQKIAARRRLRLLSLPDNLLRPALGCDPDAATDVVTVFADAALGVGVPRQATVSAMMRLLWAPGRDDVTAPVADEDDLTFDDDGEDPQAYPAHVTTAARRHVDLARQQPTRLSALLAGIDADPSLDEESREATIELLTLSVLWAFDPSLDEDDPTDQVDLVAADLEATADGTPLRHPWAYGEDLLVGPRASLEDTATGQAGTDQASLDSHAAFARELSGDPS